MPLDAAQVVPFGICAARCSNLSNHDQVRSAQAPGLGLATTLAGAAIARRVALSRRRRRGRRDHRGRIADRDAARAALHLVALAGTSELIVHELPASLAGVKLLSLLPDPRVGPLSETLEIV